MEKSLLIAMLAYFTVVNNCRCTSKSCVEVNYSFAVQSQIIPDKDSISVGDTIYLISSFSTKLRDQLSGTIIDYSGAKKIGSNLRVGELITGEDFPKDAVFNFDYVSIKGRIYNDRNIPSPDAVQQLEYEKLNGNYELKVGLIALKKGIFGLSIGDGIGIGRNNCEKASFSVSFINTAQHLYFYQNWKPGYVISEYEQKHMYCFKVY